jgi:hypothetical protein
MTYPSNQNQSAGAIPVYLVSQPNNGPWPNAQSMANGAIPVVFVSQPSSGQWPSDQSKAGGAIPVRVVSAPTGNGPFSDDRGANTGAIPVWDATSLPAHATTYPNAQNKAGGAIPVWRVN